MPADIAAAAIDSAAGPPTVISQPQAGGGGRAAAFGVQPLAVSAELQHLAEHGCLAGAAGRHANRLERTHERRGAGVVRIVDDRDAAGQPQQLAAMRGRPEPRRARDNFRQRDAQLHGHGGGGQDVREVAEAEQRRVQPGRSGARANLRRGAFQAERLDAARFDVRCRLDAEGDHPAGERTDARHDPGVVRVGNDPRRGRGVLQNLPLGVCNRVRRGEEAKVRVADVRPDPDVRLGDADERPDFAWMIHAQLDDRHVRLVPQFEQRERQADVVVEIPLVPDTRGSARSGAPPSLPWSSSCRRFR